MLKLFATVSIFIFSISTHATQKFERALIFSGGAFNTATLLGTLEGARQMDRNPDVLISTCGGSIAAAIAYFIPDSAGQKRFLKSPAFHRLLRSVTMTDYATAGGVAELVTSMKIDAARDVIPDIFREYLMNMPTGFPLDGPFERRDLSIIMVGARLDYGPYAAGHKRAGGKLYNEVFFTDPETAQLIDGMPSPIAAQFPNSAVSTRTTAITRYSVAQALRASISDMFYMTPQKLDDDYYITGAIDNYPIELAHQAANEVIATFREPFAFHEQAAVAATFRYDMNARIRHYHAQYADYWIDFSDRLKKIQNLGPVIGFDVQDPWLFAVAPLVGLSESVHFKMGTPEDLAEYARMVDVQWEYARARTVEALKRPMLDDQRHIRMIQKNNRPEYRVQP